VITEADSCRKYVLPKLYAAGWNDDQISEQKSFTDGRILVVGNKARRRPSKGADYLLRYARDFMLAVVEAKAAYKLPGDGLQQAKDYAAILGLKFAYSTNGHGIVEFDFTTGKERPVDVFPKPAELWQRFRAGEKIEDEEAASRLLTPSNAAIGKGQRYYQEIAHQPGRSGGPAGQETNSPHHGDGHRQDRRGFSNLLEALEHAVEPRR
jgi:type I restriction enzyme, R subunit